MNERNNTEIRITWIKRGQSLGAEADMKRVRITPSTIPDLNQGEVFVFGTDGYGEHSYGASRYAVKVFGAIPGQAEGLQGRSYAIPTEHFDAYEIKPYVDRFTAFARTHPYMTFLVTPIGCGAAGHTPQEIAPLFIEASDLKNVCLPESFWDALDR